MMTIVNQGKVHVCEGTWYDTTVEQNSNGEWEFIWISYFEGNEMGRGSKGPFTNKNDAEAERDIFDNCEVSKGNVVHSR